MRILLALVLALPLFAKLPDLPAPNEKWISFRVAEFEFISNASPAKTTAIARDILRMQDAIGQITKLTVRSKKPTKVLIFASERGFAPYRDTIFGRKSETTTGLFLASDTGNFILLRADLEEVDHTVHHELTHYFFNNSAANLPLWFTEGIAEYYSTFNISGDDAHIGRLLINHVQWLQREKFIPLRELFGITVDSPEYNEGTRQGVFYAQSWALVHYLMTDARKRSALIDFINLVRREGKDIDQAFSEAFGLTYAKLEQELRTYIRGRKFTYAAIPLRDLELREVPKPEPMSHDAVLYTFGHLLARTPATASVAERFLTEALAVNPNHAGVHADLGGLHELAGRRNEAEAAFEKATEIGTTDAEVYLLHGVSIVNRLAANGHPSREDMLKARASFQRATELEPDLARAWAGLGATYVESGDDPGPAIAALEKSLALDPGNENAIFYLVQFYADAGRREQAARLARRLDRSKNPQLVEQTRQALLIGDMRHIESLANAGKYVEAKALANQVLESATHPRLREIVQSHLKEIERMESERAAIAAVKDAAIKAIAGKDEEALAILDAALPMITDPELLDRVKKLREELTPKPKKKGWR